MTLETAITIVVTVAIVMAAYGLALAFLAVMFRYMFGRG